MNTVLIVIALAGLAAILGFMLKMLHSIHALVNSRLTEALDDISALKKALTNARRQKRP